MIYSIGNEEEQEKGEWKHRKEKKEKTKQAYGETRLEYTLKYTDCSGIGERIKKEKGQGRTRVKDKKERVKSLVREEGQGGSIMKGDKNKKKDQKRERDRAKKRADHSFKGKVHSGSKINKLTREVSGVYVKCIYERV